MASSLIDSSSVGSWSPTRSILVKASSFHPRATLPPHISDIQSASYLSSIITPSRNSRPFISYVFTSSSAYFTSSQFPISNISSKHYRSSLLYTSRWTTDFIHHNNKTNLMSSPSFRRVIPTSTCIYASFHSSHDEPPTSTSTLTPATKPQSCASTTLARFTGLYIFLLGTALLLFPAKLFSLLVPGAVEVSTGTAVTGQRGVAVLWIRLGAVLTQMFGVYYWGIASGRIGAMWASVWARMYLGMMFITWWAWERLKNKMTVVAAAGTTVPALVPVLGAINLIGALTMGRVLRLEANKARLRQVANENTELPQNNAASEIAQMKVSTLTKNAKLMDNLQSIVSDSKRSSSWAQALTSKSTPSMVHLFDHQYLFRAILEGHKDMIKTISLSSDASYAVTSSADGTAKVWSLKQLSMARSEASFAGTPHIFTPAYSLDHYADLYSAHFAGCTMDIENAEGIAEVPPLATSFKDNKDQRGAYLWTWKKGKAQIQKRIAFLASEAHSVEFSPSAKCFVQRTVTGDLKVWSSGLPEKGNGINDLVTALENKMWNGEKKNDLLAVLANNNEIIATRLVWSQNESYVACGLGVWHYAAKIKVWSLNPTTKDDSSSMADTAPPRSPVDLQPEGQLLVLPMWSRKLSKLAVALCFSLDAAYLAVADYQGIVFVHDVATGNIVSTFAAIASSSSSSSFTTESGSGSTTFILSVKFLPEIQDPTGGRRIPLLLTATTNGAVVWDPNTRKEALCLPEHNRSVGPTVVSEDGNLILCARTEKPIVYVWKRGPMEY